VGGFAWRFGVSFRLDGDADWIIRVASSGLFLSLEHSGCQMLGLNSRGLSSPKHERCNAKVGTEVYERTKTVNAINNSSEVSHQCASQGLYIGEIKGHHYNIRSAPIQPLDSITTRSRGHYRHLIFTNVSMFSQSWADTCFPLEKLRSCNLWRLFY
jgi:hypothetical protein